jgi:cell division protein FtsI (penicillin-binding protein 3)
LETNRSHKIAFLYYGIILFGFIIFLAAMFYIVGERRPLPPMVTSDFDMALRGSIISSDNYTVVSSKKLFKAEVDVRNIDPAKMDLFVNLFSIYSDIDKDEIKKILKSKFGNVVLSYSIDAKTAQHLRQLARNLMQMGVFVTYKDEQKKISFLHGLSINESGEYRDYSFGDTLTPVAGYIRKVHSDDITRVTGIKGLEKYYNNDLNPIQNGNIIGPRDVVRNIILNKDSKITKKIDGYDLHLNINLALQKITENILDRYKNELEAQEIMASIMRSDTGEVLALATSNRFDPNDIQKEDYPNLNSSAVEFAYEPGSVMKTITFALLLKEGKVNPYDIVKAYNGRYKLGRKVITDEHKFDWLSAEDVIVHSSNIGIAQLAQNLEGIEFHNGLKEFGFTKKSEIDMTHESTGVIPSIRQLNAQIYKATVSYGYGMTANFMQVLRAYNVFNNNGRLIEPKIVSYLQNQNSNKFYISNDTYTQVLPVDIAKRVSQILIKTVQKGTGEKAKIEGLEIGGKTGTAHIAEDGSYANRYNSSFFGFANDKKSKFTIGVTTREPGKKWFHFASVAAVPVFKEIVEELIVQGYLTPEF